ncbi:hypothetical protein LCGC14_2090200, partial [marine sediment metagenome]
MKNLYHPNQLWEVKIDVWLWEMSLIISYDIYDPTLFKNMVFEHMTKALCKDIDTILDSLLYLAKAGIKFRQSFYIIRAVEKLSVDWKYRISFLKITETFILIMMVYVVKSQDAMNTAVILAENFKIDSESFDEEIHGLKLFLPVTHLVGISFESIVKEYRYLWKQVVPSRAAILIRRKYWRMIEEVGFVEREGGMKNWIKVWWHCLLRTVTLKTSHRMSTLTIFETKKVYHFCSCGYLEPDFPG